MKQKNSIGTKSNLAISVCLGSILLTACNHEEDFVWQPSLHNAVIATQASDFTSGDHAVIRFSDYATKVDNLGSGSDLVVSTYNESIYRIGRFGLNDISKFDINSPESSVWNYSTDDEIENVDTSSNPYKIVFLNEQKAFVIRYGSDKIWVVNPSAEEAADYRLGEIDLADYADEDGSPEVSDALVVDGNLIVTMQRLNQLNNNATGDAYVAIFNATDLSEISTNDDPETPDGIALTLKNPGHVKYLESNNSLYVSAVGKYEVTWTVPQQPAEYTGGIEAIDLADYSTTVILDDGDTDNHPYGQINNIAVLDSTQGYFIGYNAYQDTTVYSINLETGEVAETPLLENLDVSDIEIGPEGNLWVANRSEAGITIFDTSDNSIKTPLISTELLPINIAFITLQQ